MPAQHIVFYGKESCADCKRSRRLLDSRGIVYEYRDIEVSPIYLAEMLKLAHGRYKTPTIVWDNKIVQEPSNSELLDELERR